MPQKKTLEGRRRYRSRHKEALQVYNSEYVRKCRYKLIYGITVEQYEKMLELQGGVCAICGNPPGRQRLAVEHDHGPSKRVRGLACWKCNKYRIGMNTVETARKILAYLESSFDGRVL